jgi:hypothetical protein
MVAPTIKRTLAFAFWLLLCGFAAQGQTYTFKCVTDADTKDTDPDSCEGCAIWEIDSRSFNGLLIYEDAVPWRWIEMPYTLKVRGDTIDIWEHTSPPSRIGYNLFFPDRESITLGQTTFATMQNFIDSCWCPFGAGMAGGGTVQVDTPIIGDGSLGSPLTIGQFGADTTMFLNWNGSHWYPAKIQFTDLLIDLPYYTGDVAAIAAGLMPGDAYLLECNNDYGLPAGLFKVVKGCVYDCDGQLLYYVNDAVAHASGVPIGREYAVNGSNIYGILYGFIKAVASDTLSNDSLVCSTVLPFYVNDVAALIGGLAFGDLYNMAQANTYGAPWGQHRAVSAIASSSADSPICCEVDATLPYYINDGAAIAGGLVSGNYYYLAAANTLGYPYGSKKVIP